MDECRGAYLLRNHGVDAVAEMSRRATEEKAKKERESVLKNYRLEFEDRLKHVIKQLAA